MGTVRRLTARPGAPGIGSATAAFLATIVNANTARSYAIALRALTAELGEHALLAELEGEAGADRIAAWFTAAGGVIRTGWPVTRCAASAAAHVRRTGPGRWPGPRWSRC